MQRDERVLEVALEATLSRVAEVKASLLHLLQKLEQEGDAADWPSYLQQYSVISAQMITLHKLLRNDKTPVLRNFLTLPLQLNAEPDQQLLRLTENRVPSFGHDFVPDLLRTKVEPELELKYRQLNAKMAAMNADTASKHINQHNKVVKHLTDVVSAAREEWESETASRASLAQTCSVIETQALLAALGTGKGLRPTPTSSAMAAASLPQQQAVKRGPQHSVKAPSIKTNIKSHAHPYSR